MQNSKYNSGKLVGSCYCGNIEWQAELPPTTILNCHCNMCRQLSGADYSSWVILLSSQFTVVKGANFINQYQATNAFSKAFCAHCGSTISCVNNDKFPEHIYVARGNIKTAFDFPAELQVYTIDKANWVKLDDNLPAINP